ncbi:hypothetical protein LINGRAHAP2_LOCUS12465 [Linum grandiflorum]
MGCLMQNCDLPPPSKLYYGSHHLIVSSFELMVQQSSDDGQDDEKEVEANGTGNEKVELLKAVRLSQTRAREAEKRKEWISNALSAESLQLFAYRQWSKLLQMRILKLEAELAERRDGVEPEPCLPWTLALAVCLGFAGAGIVYGFSYWF